LFPRAVARRRRCIAGGTASRSTSTHLTSSRAPSGFTSQAEAASLRDPNSLSGAGHAQRRHYRNARPCRRALPARFSAAETILRSPLRRPLPRRAYYLTQPFNSWQMVLIGDPLYKPFPARREEQNPQPRQSLNPNDLKAVARPVPFSNLEFRISHLTLQYGLRYLNRVHWRIWTMKRRSVTGECFRSFVCALCLVSIAAATGTSKPLDAPRARRTTPVRLESIQLPEPATSSASASSRR